MCHVYKTWIRAAYVGGTDYWPNQSNALVVERCTGWTFCWIEWLVVQIISENLISMKRKRTKTFSRKSHCFKQCLMQNFFFYLLANSCRIFVHSAPADHRRLAWIPLGCWRTFEARFTKSLRWIRKTFFFWERSGKRWRFFHIVSLCFMMFHWEYGTWFWKDKEVWPGCCVQMQLPHRLQVSNLYVYIYIYV